MLIADTPGAHWGRKPAAGHVGCMVFISDFNLCCDFFFFNIPPPFKDKHNLLNFAILFLLHRNIASQTVARLKDVARRISSCLDFEQHSRERSASLDLLLRFQRLLISKLYPGENIGQTSEVSSKLLKVLKCLVCVLTFLFRLFDIPILHGPHM